MLCFNRPSIYKQYTKQERLIKTNNSTIYIIVDKNKKKYILKKQLLSNYSIIKNEIKCLTHLHTLTNISKLIKHEYYLYKSYLVLEYIDGITLFNYLDTNPDKKDIIDIIYQLIVVFKVIHQKKVIHRDIKLDNIMIENNQIKVIDFGYSLIVKDIDLFTTNEPCGSYPYMCPEMVEYRFYNTKCDTWSLGVLFYVLMTDVFPYSLTKHDVSMYQMFKTGLKKKTDNINFNKIKNNKIKHMIRRMLVYNTDERVKIIDL